MQSHSSVLSCQSPFGKLHDKDSSCVCGPGSVQEKPTAVRGNQSYGPVIRQSTLNYSLTGIKKFVSEARSFRQSWKDDSGERRVCRNSD